MGKNNEYLEISKQIVANIGGMDNIQGTAHCATRLRIVLKDNDLADIEKLEDIDKVKGAFIAGNQLQLILGAGTVNDVYEVFAEYTNTQNRQIRHLQTRYLETVSLSFRKTEPLWHHVRQPYHSYIQPDMQSDLQLQMEQRS